MEQKEKHKTKSFTNKLAKQNGVTLIALVVTIVILIILAAVSINMLVGENGIIAMADKAEKDTEIEEAKAKSELEQLANQMEEYTNVDGGNGGTTGTFPQVAVDTKAEQNSTINGEEGTYSNPVIPKGFKAINTEKANWTDANGYKGGLVIEDVTEDTQTQESQFVWVPVPSFTEFKAIEGYYNENPDTKLSSCKEPKTTTEAIAMYKSVEDNGGFYIARYEAGISPAMPPAKLASDSTATYAGGDGTYKPVSKQNAYVWNYIAWGGTSAKKASDGLQGNDNANGAVKVARSMYTGNSNTTVKSTLCYGVQWDATMQFIDSDYLVRACKKDSFVRNSTGQGNYSDSDNNNNPARAGDTTYTAYKVKNIFDLGGNVYEWTMEAISSSGRVIRGGSHMDSGSSKPASSRYGNYYYPDYAYRFFGFRVVLYL